MCHQSPFSFQLASLLWLQSLNGMHPALWGGGRGRGDIQAQVSIDLLFCGPQADVQGFFDQQYRVPAGGFIQYSDITPVYCMSILPGMLCNC